MQEQLKEKIDNKENTLKEEFEYYLVFFSFNNEYNLIKKQELLKSIINKLVNYYFPNAALFFSSNAVVIKQNKHSGTTTIDRYVEDALFGDDNNNYDSKTALRIIDIYDISYFIIAVDFKLIKKYLINYKKSLLDFFEKIDIPKTF